MTDISDKASEAEEVFLQEALAKQRGRTSTGTGLTHCEDCGDAIPEARRQAVPGCTRCVYCQEYFEHGYP